MRTQSWEGLLRKHGPDFLAWLRENKIARQRAELIAEATRKIFQSTVCNQNAAEAIWAATPAVLNKCNEQSTYALPLAPFAYAWLHLLDRYARTWRALEILVENGCLPLAKYGVNALDIGTGPGPSAFATNDFYQALVEFSVLRGIPEFRQPPNIQCVEFDPSTNHFRHQLAELVGSANPNVEKSTFSLCWAIPDFSELNLARGEVLKLLGKGLGCTLA